MHTFWEYRWRILMRQMQLDLRDTTMCYSLFFSFFFYLPLMVLFSVMMLSHFHSCWICRWTFALMQKLFLKTLLKLDFALRALNVNWASNQLLKMVMRGRNSCINGRLASSEVLLKTGKTGNLPAWFLKAVRRFWWTSDVSQTGCGFVQLYAKLTVGDGESDRSSTG